MIRIHYNDDIKIRHMKDCIAIQFMRQLPNAVFDLLPQICWYARVLTEVKVDQPNIINCEVEEPNNVTKLLPVFFVVSELHSKSRMWLGIGKDHDEFVSEPAINWFKIGNVTVDALGQI